MSEEQKAEEAQDAPQQEQVGDGMYYPPGYQKPEESSDEGNSQNQSNSGADEQDDDPTDKIAKGWAEDRQKLETIEEENRRLKIQLSQRKGDEDDDDELDGMTEDERVEYLVNKKEREKQQQTTAQKEREKSELRFFRTTNRQFIANEKGILKFQKENGLDLKQATKLYMAQQEAIKKAKGTGNTVNHQRNAQAPQGQRVYNKATDMGKSFGEFFRGN